MTQYDVSTTRHDENVVVQCPLDEPAYRDLLMQQRRYYIGLVKAIETTLGVDSEEQKLRREIIRVRGLLKPSPDT